MFYILDIKKRDNTLFEKLFGCFFRDEYDIQTIPVFKGAPFGVVSVTVGKRGVCWENVMEILGKCAQRLVVSDKIILPPNMNIGVFKSNILYDKMMKNSFVQILKNNHLEKHPLPISILDESGKNAEFTKELSNYAKTLSITTQNKEKYFHICDEITEETGMCPTVSENFADAFVKINTNENTMTVNGYLNISNGLDFTVPEIYENLLPKGIDKYEFYSALYELCGVFSLGDMIFDYVIVNNEKKRLTSLSFT